MNYEQFKAACKRNGLVMEYDAAGYERQRLARASAQLFALLNYRKEYALRADFSWKVWRFAR